MQAHDLVARFSQASQGPRPMAGARATLERLANEIDAVDAALSYLNGTGGNAAQAFYRSPNLSLLKVKFPVGRRTPPHDHGTWAAILLLCGAEKNTLYRREDDGRLRRASEVLLERGSILAMSTETVHVAECVGGEPAIGLHVYGGDILNTVRHMWHPETLEMHCLDWSLYEQFALKAAAASSAP